MNKSIISYSIVVRSACYGGPVTISIEYFTREISNTNNLMLEELFLFGKIPQPQLSEGEYKWTQYRYKDFGPTVFGLLRSAYSRKFEGDKYNECDYNNLKNWYFPKWHLTPKGLYLEPTSMLSYNNCDHEKWSVISFEN